MLSDPWKDFLNPKEINVEPIARLPSVLPFAPFDIDNEEGLDHFEDLPDVSKSLPAYWRIPTCVVRRYEQI